MNIRDLRYLVALAATGHFGRASEQCFVSQPTLSMQIKKLEAELDVQLFERGKRFVKATPEGEIIIRQAQQALDIIDGIKEASKRMRDPLSGDLRLAIFPTLSPYLLPKITRPMKKTLPNVSLKIYEYLTQDCISKLYSGELDAALIAHEVNDPRLQHQYLFTESFELACANDHPLAKQADVTTQAIPYDELLLLQEGHCLRDQALEFCQSVDAHPSLDYTATSLPTLLAMVSLGEGVTLVPALSIPAINKKSLVIRPLQQPCPSRSIYLHWRSSFHRDVLMDSLADVIRKAVEGLPGIS